MAAATAPSLSAWWPKMSRSQLTGSPLRAPVWHVAPAELTPPVTRQMRHCRLLFKWQVAHSPLNPSIFGGGVYEPAHERPARAMFEADSRGTPDRTQGSSRGRGLDHQHHLHPEPDPSASRIPFCVCPYSWLLSGDPGTTSSTTRTRGPLVSSLSAFHPDQHFRYIGTAPMLLAIGWPDASRLLKGCKTQTQEVT